jgi:hypothetical protein
MHSWAIVAGNGRERGDGDGGPSSVRTSLRPSDPLVGRLAFGCAVGRDGRGNPAFWILRLSGHLGAVAWSQVLSPLQFQGGNPLLARVLTL